MNITHFLFTSYVVATIVNICLGMRFFNFNNNKKYQALILSLQKGEYNLPTSYNNDEIIIRHTNTKGEKQTLFCPSESVTVKKIHNKCLTPISDNVSSCQKPVKPILIKSNQLKIKCGPGGNSLYYDFVYRICIPDNEKYEDNPYEIPLKTDDHIIYRICYNTGNKETVFTYYRIISPDLLTNISLKKESQISFEFDVDGDELPSENFVSLKDTFINIKKRFQNLHLTFGDLKPGELKPLKLVPPEHMAFVTWKIPAHHYINVKPAWEFTIKMWDEINEYIKNKVFKRAEVIQINGAFDIWKINGDTIYLDDNETITIPKCFWKLIYIPVKKAISALIVHNVPDEKNNFQKLCQMNSNSDIKAQLYEDTSINPEFAYFCDYFELTYLFDLPLELDLLLKNENFNPLVLNYSDGTYNLPKTYNGLEQTDISDNQGYFCPFEDFQFQENCLIPNFDENVYCIRPVIPTWVDSTNFVTMFNIDVKAVDYKSLGYLICIPDDANVSFSKENQAKIAVTKKQIEIFSICTMKHETVTFHRISSPLLHRYKKLEYERTMEFFSKYDDYRVDYSIFKTITTNYAYKKQYTLEDGVLVPLTIVSPIHMVFATWKKPTYYNENIKFAWSKVENIWNIINKQLLILAMDKNEELIQISGTLDAIQIHDEEIEYNQSIAKYFWILVYTPDMRNNLAIVVQSEEIEDDSEGSNKLCDGNKCNIERWNFNALANLEQYAYCCDAKVITDYFNFPAAQEVLEINEYHLPLILVYRDYHLNFPLTYHGLETIGDDQEEIHLLFCPSQTVPTNKAEEYCLKYLDSALPYCMNPVKPFLVEHQNEGSCGIDNKGRFYYFKYKVCFEENGKIDSDDFVMYKICFDSETEETHYTYHSIHSVALLNNPNLRDERKMHFKIDNNNYGLAKVNYNTIKRTLNEVHYRFPDYKSSLAAMPLFLVSPRDMAFAVWKIPIFHYINVKLAWKNVFEIWDDINDKIRQLAMNENSNYAEENGSMNNLEVKEAKFYMVDGVGRIPELFWKIVHNLEVLKDIVIIVYNVPHKKFITKKPCNENICKKRPDLEFLATSYDEIVFCCDPADIRKKFNLK